MEQLKIKDVKTLEHISKYQLTDFCRSYLSDCILRAKGLPDGYDEYLNNTNN